MRHIAVLSLMLAGGCNGEPPEGTRRTMDGTFTYSIDAYGESCELTRTLHATERPAYPWTCAFCDGLYDTTYVMEDDLTDCTDDDYVAFSFDGTPDLLVLGPDYWDLLGVFFVPETYRASEMMAAEPGSVLDGEQVEIRTAFQSDMITENASFEGLRSSDIGPIEPLEQQSKRDSCGWGRSETPAYTGSYAATTGEVFPDGLVRDACGDLVRMHDFFGSYLLVEWGSLGCAPCEKFAEASAGLLQELQDDGIDVAFLSVYAVGDLSGTPVSRDELDTFIDASGATHPFMMDDVGWMSAVVEQSGYGGLVPVTFLLRPDGTVFYQQSGVEEGEWGAEFLPIIRAEAASR